MLVEDDPATRSALVRLYTRQGWVVDAAGSIAEAIALLGHRPDSVILDLMLPDGDGEAVLRAIRGAGLSPRIVVTTGITDQARIQGVRALGPDLILFKPIRFRDLNDALKP